MLRRKKTHTSLITNYFLMRVTLMRAMQLEKENHNEFATNQHDITMFYVARMFMLQHK